MSGSYWNNPCSVGLGGFCRWCVRWWWRPARWRCFSMQLLLVVESSYSHRHILARWCEKRDLVPAVLIRFAPLSIKLHSENLGEKSVGLAFIMHAFCVRVRAIARARYYYRPPYLLSPPRREKMESSGQEVSWEKPPPYHYQRLPQNDHPISTYTPVPATPAPAQPAAPQHTSFSNNTVRSPLIPLDPQITRLLFTSQCGWKG